MAACGNRKNTETPRGQQRKKMGTPRVRRGKQLKIAPYTPCGMRNRDCQQKLAFAYTVRKKRREK